MLVRALGNENKPGAPRTVWSNLQKEGSRVIFGVPKPGKKKEIYGGKQTLCCREEYEN